jgi:O-succinylhomoserine (thiol)-lyase
MQFQTRCVHTGVDKDTSFNSVITPIYQSSTFYYDDLDSPPPFDYTRSGNPTRTALEENLASLEGGTQCRATSTGMSAIAAIMHLFRPGDHIIAGNDLYGGTFRLFNKVCTDSGLLFSFVDMADLDNIRAARQPNTKAIWIETPSNPLLRVFDIAGIVAVAAEMGAITIADNTFLSPYLQRPLELGVDIVMHSTTKYLNGHSDVVGGCIITNDKEHSERIAYLVNAMGVACSPFDAWLVLRGIKTLPLRMEAHQRGAMALAEMLAAHPRVERVYYPGLPSHPQHELARRQQSGFGAMLSFDIRGDRAAAERFLSRLQLYYLGVSLGGVESLVCYPETMSHAAMTPEARLRAGISERTIRVSAGIEDPADLVADMRQALE